MKKITFIIVAVVTCLNLHAFGQKLEENKKDTFTNKVVKRTSWENFFTTMTANAYFRISKVDSLETFDLKYQDGTVCIIGKDQEMMLKLSNGDVITLTNQERAVSCTGCGAKGLVGSSTEGIETSYFLNKDQADKLKANKVLEVRIITVAKTLEHDVKDKNAAKIISSLSLI